MTNPRDPRLRRATDRLPRSPLEAAVALEVAADRMRSALRAPEPEVDYPVPVVDPVVLEAVSRWDAAAELAALAEDTTRDGDPGGLDEIGVEPAEAATEQGDDPEPGWLPAPSYVAGGQVPEPPAAPVAPAPSAPAVFQTEHPPAAWRSRHDERSRRFGVADRLPGRGPLQRVELPVGPVLDQRQAGDTPEQQSCCTGCGLVAALNILRPGAGFTLDDAEAIYERAKQLDEVPGEAYAGTSVLGALQAAVEQGVIGGYLWCFGTRDIAQTLIQRRLPVVIGIPWLSGMWETGPGGLVVVEGDDTGLGHVLTIVGLELAGPQGQPGPYFRWQNSAGPDYGDGGFGWVHHRDLAALLHGIGEAAVPTLEPQAPR